MKVSPPLRSEADRKAVVAGLADGTIDAVAGDHTPSDQDSKRLPFATEYGIVGLETLPTLTLEPFHNGEIGLLEALAKITSNPARMLGLKVADCSVAPRRTLSCSTPIHLGASKKKASGANLRTRRSTAGVQGRVLETLVDGRSVYKLAA